MLDSLLSLSLPVPILLAILVVALVILLGVKSVPQGEEHTVERFGRYIRTLRPGLNIITPFIDRIGKRLNMMEQVLDVPSQEVISRDNAMIRVDAVVFYQILDAAKAAYEVRELERAILNLATTNLRTVMGSMDLDHLLSQRDTINAQLLTVIDQATSPWGIKVTRVEVKDIEPPADLVEAMGRQMKAERDKRAAVLEAEGLRQSEILKAEGLKQAAILQAEGEREAAFRDAEARERLAAAEAVATETLSKAIEAGSPQAINYFLGVKYVEAFAKLADAPQQKVVMLPMESSQLLASLGGIGEIAREAFAPGQARAPRERASRLDDEPPTPPTPPTGSSGPWQSAT